MYFPYLRCKQFELLALRELVPELGDTDLISPVLEPVKKSMSSFDKAIEILIAANYNFTIVINPKFGELRNSRSEILGIINEKLTLYENFQFGVILDESTNLASITALLAQIRAQRPLTFIHAGRIENTEVLATWCTDRDIKYNLYGENFPARRYRGIIAPGSKVLLEDKFKLQIKNADYVNSMDEFFSDDHLYFEEDGFTGFGDYLTIGNDYSESGWLPYAIAIHLTYKAENGVIRIRHFVSDSNSDTTDVPGKFGEALKKLITFINEHNITTIAANEFRALAAENHYPGLGSLKKLSIKNHIELVYRLIS